MRLRRFAFAVVVGSTSLLVAPFDGVSAQESGSFVMSRVTLTATGGVATSPSFEMRATFGQAVPVGAVSRCNDGYHQSAGFWSLRGDQPVPASLLINKDPANPGGVILIWTGSASHFDLYRSSAAPSVIDPGNYRGSALGCTTADLPPDAAQMFYQVVPSEP